MCISTQSYCTFRICTQNVHRYLLCIGTLLCSLQWYPILLYFLYWYSNCTVYLLQLHDLILQFSPGFNWIFQFITCTSGILSSSLCMIWIWNFQQLVFMLLCRKYLVFIYRSCLKYGIRTPFCGGYVNELQTLLGSFSKIC